MRLFILFALAVAVFTGCKKEENANVKVEIYLLKSFSLSRDTTTFPIINQIENAVLEDAPLVADHDIKSYVQSETSFILKKDINAQIKNFNKQKGFAVVVNGEPVYYGWFYPAYYSSIEFGLARITPELTTNRIYLEFPGEQDLTILAPFDKRNDDRILWAMSVSGRLK